MSGEFDSIYLEEPDVIREVSLLSNVVNALFDSPPTQSQPSAMQFPSADPSQVTLRAERAEQLNPPTESGLILVAKLLVPLTTQLVTNEVVERLVVIHYSSFKG